MSSIDKGEIIENKIPDNKEEEEKEKEQPEFAKSIPKIDRKFIDQCWKKDPKEYPSLEEITLRLQKQEDFITKDFDPNTVHSIEESRESKQITSNKEEEEEKHQKITNCSSFELEPYKEEEEHEINNLYKLILKNPILLNFTPLNIKNYKKEEFISSCIYKIIDLRTNHYFTAKIFIDKYNKTLLRTDSNEITILSQISHPSIIKYIGYSPFDFEERNNPAIITEFYRNGTLDQILQFENEGKKIEGWNMTTKLINIYGIATAMSYLHSQDIIHRDIKPGNIFIDDCLFPKLGGFDISIKLNDINVKEERTIDNPSYIAPEIYKNQIYSKASDVFAFGFTIYEILTGSFAFDNLECFQIMYKISIKHERPEFTKPIPENYKDLIEKCWNDDPQKRPSFEEIVNRLKNEKEFITEDVDANMYRSYIEFIDNKLQIIEPTRKSNQILQANIYRKLESITDVHRKIIEIEKKQIIELLQKESMIDLNQFNIIEEI